MFISIITKKIYKIILLFVIEAVNHLIAEAEKVQRSRAARSGTDEKTPVSPIDAIAVTNDLTTAV